MTSDFLESRAQAEYIVGRVLRGLLAATGVVVVCTMLVSWSQQQLVVGASAGGSAESGFLGGIDTEKWDFYFYPIDRLMGNIQVDSSGQLQLDAGAQRLLKSIYAKLPSNLDDKNYNRLRLLIKKSYPDSHGQQLTNLLARYIHYQKSKDSFLQQADLSREQRFKQLIQLRESVFGVEVARLLYEHQYRFLNHLTQSAAIAGKPL
jgi:hypothetical protein